MVTNTDGGRLNDYNPLEQAVQMYEGNGTFSDDRWQRQAKVSVIVTTYNQEDQLMKQLSALSQQTYSRDNFEVVIVDDGGKRGTGSSLDHIAKTDFGFDVKYIWQEDKGFRLSKARNEAVKRSSHEHTVIIDSDMIMSHTYLEDVMKWHYAAKQAGTSVMTTQDRAFVEPEDMSDELIAARKLDEVKTSPSRRFGDKKDWRHARYEQSDRLKNIPEGVADKPYFVGSTFSGGNCSFKRADAFEAGLFDEEFTDYGAEDTEFGVRMYDHFNVKLGKPLYFIPVDTTAYHIEHGGSMESQMGEKQKQLFWKKIAEARAKRVAPIPEVSVYVPCYNQAEFVEDAIASIAEQNFDLSKLEVVIGEDGSTDGTKQILSRLQREYAGELQIRVIDDGKNHGMAENTNRTIQACRGKYVIQLDPDDELLPNAVGSLYEVLKSNPHAGTAFGDCVDRDVATGKTRPHWSCAEFTTEWYRNNSGSSKGQILKTLRAGMRIHHPRMFSREHFFRTEGVTPTLENAVDFDLYIKLAEVGAPIHRRERLYTYNVNHGGNTSDKRGLQMANGEVVKEASVMRENPARTRKEVYIVDDTSGRERTQHFDLVDPTFRERELSKMWREGDSSKHGTPTYKALVSELERTVSFFRWVNPEVAKKQLDTLLRINPNSNTGKYFQATYLLHEGKTAKAQQVISQVRGPSARSLEARINGGRERGVA